MEKAFLETCLAEGLSLEAIGDLVERHPSTVGYWLKKHGLSTGQGGCHSPKGGLSRSELEGHVSAGLTIRQIAEHVDRSPTTVRYWLARYGLAVVRGGRPRRSEGRKNAIFNCRRHGQTTFVLEGRGSYRCAACRAESVANRRRAIKRMLVEEAGGKCSICGYSKCQQALQFHHLDPATKEFHLGSGGLTRSIAKSRAETRKCILLCGNCHVEVEAGLVALPLNFIEEGRSDVAHSGLTRSGVAQLVEALDC
jgi:hypothetical protein